MVETTSTASEDTAHLVLTSAQATFDFESKSSAASKHLEKLFAI